MNVIHIRPSIYMEDAFDGYFLNNLYKIINKFFKCEHTRRLFFYYSDYPR